jgi:hypothetical protein
MNILQDDDFQRYLEVNGWTVECESPLEIRHEEGSFATLYAAKVLLGELEEQYKEERNVADKTVSADEEYPHQHTFEKLLKLFDAMENYVNTAQEQEYKDKDRTDETDEKMSRDAYALWDTTYSLVFNKNLSTKIKDCLAELNVDLEYYDPDTSYKEDVLAYYEAVKSEVETLTKLIQPNNSKKMRF